MRELNSFEHKAVSGGPGPLAVVAAILVAAEVADIAYNAAKAFKEGYDAKDEV